MYFAIKKVAKNHVLLKQENQNSEGTFVSSTFKVEDTKSVLRIWIFPLKSFFFVQHFAWKIWQVLNWKSILQ